MHAREHGAVDFVAGLPRRTTGHKLNNVNCDEGAGKKRGLAILEPVILISENKSTLIGKNSNQVPEQAVAFILYL